MTDKQRKQLEKAWKASGSPGPLTGGNKYINPKKKLPKKPKKKKGFLNWLFS